MREFESASACGESAPVRVWHKLRRRLSVMTCQRIEIVPVSMVETGETIGDPLVERA